MTRISVLDKWSRISHATSDSMVSWNCSWRSDSRKPKRFAQRPLIRHDTWAVDTQGTVEVGKVADLVLLDANPLDDIANTQKIYAVVTNGRFFDRQALDELLAEAELAAKENSD